MSLQPPRIAVIPTGNPGQLVIQLEGPPAPIRVFYWPEFTMSDGTPQPTRTIDFLRGPGQYPTGGFLNGVWHAFFAAYIEPPELLSGPSGIVKAQPNSPIPQYAVDLRRLDQQVVVPGRTCAFRFRVEAINPRGISNAIFLYRRETFANAPDTTRDVFLSVCKTSDFDYPENAPAIAGTLFRLPYVELIERSGDYVEETWTAIVEDVEMLVRGMELLDQLEHP